MSSLRSFTAGITAGYGTPPDPNTATNGTYIGMAYNGASAMVFKFTDMSGNGVISSTKCGFTRGIYNFTACFDPTILYDRVTNTWFVTYAAATASFDQGLLVLGESPNPITTPFSWSLIEEFDNGWLDAPRASYNKQFIVLTANFYNQGIHGTYNSDKAVTINQSEFTKGQTFDWKSWAFSGSDYFGLYPTSNTAYLGTILWEAPMAPNNGLNVMYMLHIKGTVDDPVFTLYDNFIGSTAQWQQNEMFSNQGNSQQNPAGTTVFADNGYVISAAYTGGDVWGVANQTCSGSAQLCPEFFIETVDSSANSTGEPVSYVNDFQYVNGSGQDAYYVAISTTISSTNVLGVMDYSCGGSCDKLPSTKAFEVTTGGSFTFSSSLDKAGNIILPADDGTRNDARSGDYSGCDYVPGSSPAQAVCTSLFASSSSPYHNEALQVFISQM